MGLVKLATDLNEDLQQAASDAGANHIPTLGAFDGDELCTGKSDLNAINPADIGDSGMAHPNAAGQRAIEKVVSSYLHLP